MALTAKDEKGSRYRCLLTTEFEPRKVKTILSDLCKPLDIKISGNDEYYPQGFKRPEELILTSTKARQFFETHYPEIDFNILRTNVKDNWWLRPKKGGNTPNWDLVSSCEIDGKPGIILVEAKAHASEFDENGKKCSSNASTDSNANHKSIDCAIQEARSGLNQVLGGGFEISIDTCYQLSNRFAFAWKLAREGIPVVLMYLGFIKAYEMVNDYFETIEDWEKELLAHAKGVVPCGVWNNDPIKINGIPIYSIYRSMEIQSSPVLIKVNRAEKNC